MSIFVIGGTGFIGSRLIRSLAGQGETITCMDINPHTADFSDLGDQVTVVRGDMTQFDETMSLMVGAEPTRVINLSYFLGNFHPPHVATKLNIVGMDKAKVARGYIDKQAFEIVGQRRKGRSEKGCYSGYQCCD